MKKEMPIIVDLKQGTYYWCSCGKTKTQPFCDGSHKGTDYVPVEFVISERKKVALCNCQKTGKAPFCDGTHQKP
jgi:CDGSH-type Zn-finger protein